MIIKIIKILILILFFFIIIITPLTYLKKENEYLFKIDNSFEEYKFMDNVKNFLSYKKKIPKNVKVWIYKLTALITSYQSHLTSVKVIHRKLKTEAIITTKKGEIFYFINGKLLLSEDAAQEGQYRSYFYNYPMGRVYQKEKKKDFPIPLNYAFLNSLYGTNPLERENNLETFLLLGKKIRFHQKQQASFHLKNVFKEIQFVAKQDKDVKKWLGNIHVISTYINRSVENMNRQSLHSYGIAIDILPYDRSKFFYWQWVEKYMKDWWNAREEDKAKIPYQVIDIFEKNGFTWGGKWFYFDIMHFEYRPEVIKYAILLKEDPLN